MVFETLIQRVTADRVVAVDENRKIGIVGRGCAAFIHDLETLDTLQSLAVAGINLAAARHYLVHVLQLQQSEGGIDLAHFPVDTGSHHRHLVDKSKVFQLVNALLRLDVGADDSAPLERIEYLGGMKAEHAQIAVPQNTAIVTTNTERMSGVIDHFQVIDVSNLLNGINVARRTIAMNWHDCSGLGRDGCFDLRRIHIQGDRVDINKHWFQAVPQQRMGRRDEGIRRGDHLAADAQGLQGREQRDRAVVEKRNMLDTEIFT